MTFERRTRNQRKRLAKPFACSVSLSRYLSDEEEERLLKALPTDAGRQRLTVLLHTGFRRSELLGLRWKDVDFKAGVLTVPRSKNGDARHVPMTTTVRGILSRLPRQLDPTSLVFPNTEGNRDLRWAKIIIPAALRDAKIADFRFHDLRHTFASRLAMEGVDLLTIKELGGWKSLQMVQRYAHLSPSHRHSAIERLVRRPTSVSQQRQWGPSSTVISTDGMHQERRCTEVPVVSSEP
jgi:integrase